MDYNLGRYSWFKLGLGMTSISFLILAIMFFLGFKSGQQKIIFIPVNYLAAGIGSLIPALLGLLKTKNYNNTAMISKWIYVISLVLTTGTIIFSAAKNGENLVAEAFLAMMQASIVLLVPIAAMVLIEYFWRKR